MMLYAVAPRALSSASYRGKHVNLQAGLSRFLVPACHRKDSQPVLTSKACLTGR